MQLCIRNNGCHVSSNKQTTVVQLHFSNDAAVFFKMSQEFSALDHPSEILGKGSSAQGGSDTSRSASNYLCKKLIMMSCLKLDALLLQRLLGVGHMRLG